MSDQEGMGSASIQGGGDADAPFGARQIGSLALCAVDLLSWLSSPLFVLGLPMPVPVGGW